jgi:hypothetical protein
MAGETASPTPAAKRKSISFAALPPVKRRADIERDGIGIPMARADGCP